jgi:hypothetical protein
VDRDHIEELHLQNQSLYDRFIEEGIFDGAADVARVEILFRRGGTEGSDALSDVIARSRVIQGGDLPVGDSDPTTSRRSFWSSLHHVGR